MSEPQAQFVAVIGNFNDGFSFVGPYRYFDIAAQMHPGPDVWIATMHNPPGGVEDE
jgi:hypothetical protein